MFPSRFALLFAVLLTATVGDAFAQAPAPAPAAPAPPPPPGWTGSFGAGLSLAKGNSDTNNVNLSYEVKRDTGSPVLFKSTALFLRGESDGTVDTNNLQFDARVDRRFSARASVYGQMQYVHDEFKDIDYLAAATVGLGQQVVKTARTEFAVDAGAGVVWEKNPLTPMHTSGAISAGQNFKQKLTATAEVTQRFSALWKTDDFEDVFYVFGAGVAASVTTKTQLKVEVRETFKNKPPTADTQKSDLKLIVSFVFKF